MKKLGGCWALVAMSIAFLGCSSSGNDSSRVPGRSNDASSAPYDPGTNLTIDPSTPSESSAGPSSGTAAGVPDGAGPSIDTPTAPPATTPAPPTTGTTQLPRAGQLTAGVWDDNRNFDRFLAYRKGLETAQMPGLPPITQVEYQAANALVNGLPGPHQQLDIALVLDTTGSMTDELVYLQSEFISIAAAIDAAYPNAEPRWSLMLYRDHSDVYLTQSFDFSSDAVAFQHNLAGQSADGGGDIPEAPDVALTQAATLSWRSDPSVARLLFWVADAPHHDADARAMANALLGLQAKAIHVYPVAASGADELTEVTMRSAAQLTGGRYLFLTNDSGIGNDHKEPSIPCYFVTLLDKAMLRMIDVEMTGVYREPAAADVIRTGGNPQSGACTLQSGEVVQVF